MNVKNNSLMMIFVIDGKTFELPWEFETPQEMANNLLGEEGMAAWLRGTTIRGELMEYWSN